MNCGDDTGPEPADSGGRSRVGGGGLTKLRVLVVGTSDWAVEQGAADLEREDCHVLRCHEPGQPAFPCNALIEGRTCPLDAGFDVVADVRARPLGSLTPSEFGVVCALHHGFPLVVAGVDPDRPLGPWASVVVEHGADLVAACRHAASGLSGSPQPADLAGHVQRP